MVRRWPFVFIVLGLFLVTGCTRFRGSVDGYAFYSAAGTGLYLSGDSQAPEGWEPLADAAIAIEGSNSVAYSAPDGHFTFDSVKVGRRTITLTKGEEKAQRTVTVMGGVTNILPSIHPAAPKKWTILVYMAADNNLDSMTSLDIAEMESIGSTLDMNVVVQYDGAGTTAADRRLIHKAEVEPSRVLEGIGEIDMSDPKELKDFIDFGLTYFPADHVMLVLWNHGGGVWPRNLEGTAGTQGIAWDDTTGDSEWDCLTTDELRLGIADALGLHGQRRLDILNFDACMMQMYEVALELEGLADIMVGSEEATPGEGNPYDTILSALDEAPDQLPQTFAASIVDLFCEEYKELYKTSTYRPLTQSAVRISGDQWSLFKTALDEVGARMSALTFTQVRYLRDHYDSMFVYNPNLSFVDFLKPPVIRYDYPEVADLKSFLAAVGADDQLVSMHSATTSTLTALQGIVVANRVVAGEGHQALNSGGIAILLPRGLPDWQLYSRPDQYAVLKVGDTPWYQAIRALMPPVGEFQPFRFQVAWAGAELDLHVFEPHGNHYGGGFKRSTPNGELSPDVVSYDSKNVNESYTVNVQHEMGRYVLYVTCGAVYGSEPVRFSVNWTFGDPANPVVYEFTDTLRSGEYAAYTWELGVRGLTRENNPLSITRGWTTDTP